MQAQVHTEGLVERHQQSSLEHPADAGQQGADDEGFGFHQLAHPSHGQQGFAQQSNQTVPALMQRQALEPMLQSAQDPGVGQYPATHTENRKADQHCDPDLLPQTPAQHEQGTGQISQPFRQGDANAHGQREAVAPLQPEAADRFAAAPRGGDQGETRRVNLGGGFEGQGEPQLAQVIGPAANQHEVAAQANGRGQDPPAPGQFPQGGADVLDAKGGGEPEVDREGCDQPEEPTAPHQGMNLNLRAA